MGTAPLTALTQVFVQSYTYDEIGNLRKADEIRDANTPGRTAKTKNDLYAPAVLGVNEVGDQVARIGTVGVGPAAGTTAYGYDLRDHLTSVTQGSTVVERLWYGPGGELVTRQVGEAFTFYVGSYATVRARGATGCTTACEPVAGTEEEEAHVLLAGTRLSSVSTARTLYYYRSRLGSVVATSLNGGRAGARYRYDLYGKVMAAVNETTATRSELGYTDALKLSGDLIYLKARVYDAGARVFLQADVVDRQRYAYVWGDPVNLSDPTGMQPSAGVAYGQDSGRMPADKNAMRWENALWSGACDPNRVDMRALRLSQMLQKAITDAARIASEQEFTAFVHKMDLQMEADALLPAQTRADLIASFYAYVPTGAPIGMTRGAAMTGPSDSLAVPFSPQSGSGLNPILAFRGTVSLSNLLTDVRQLLGSDTKAFEWASRTAEGWIADNPNGRFAGHSLGGGLASVAALVTDHGATTINALGVHGNTLAREGVTSAAAGRLIDAFYVRGEAVSLIQDGSGLP